MIRYIDIGDQPYPGQAKHFAFYDTIINRFLAYNGSYIWQTWEEFEEDWFENYKKIDIDVSGNVYPLSRFRKLVFNKLIPEHDPQVREGLPDPSLEE